MKRLPDLTGKTVLVVGSAPCDISSILRDYTIAASGGIKNAPDADILVTIDNDMRHTGWNDPSFRGLRVVGVPSENPAHLYISLPYDSVQVAPGNVVHMRNNGISAIRVAVERGAKRVLLAGFSPAEYDALNTPYGFDGVLVVALPALIAELSGRGVSVEYVKSPQQRKRNA